MTTPWLSYTEKECKYCNTVLPLDSFSRRRASPDGLAYKCRSCDGGRPRTEYMRKWHMKKRYGIEYKTYVQMIEAQGGVCAACGSADPEVNAGDHFCVDHDHVTGEVRALLCSPCNLMLGYFKEDAERISRFASYALAQAAAQGESP
jgi:hypothetical protein